MKDPISAPSVLIVDDDAVFRDMVARLLREAGFHVLEAQDGDEGLAILRDVAQPPHVVLLDSIAPSAAVTAEAFAAHASATYPELVVLQTSSTRRPSQFATGSLPKPVSPMDLVSTVRELCGE